MEQKQKQSRHVQSHQLDHVNHPSRPNSIAQMASVAVTSIAPQQSYHLVLDVNIRSQFQDYL